MVPFIVLLSYLKWIWSPGLERAGADSHTVLLMSSPPYQCFPKGLQHGANRAGSSGAHRADCNASLQQQNLSSTRRK